MALRQQVASAIVAPRGLELSNLRLRYRGHRNLFDCAARMGILQSGSLNTGNTTR